MGKLSLSVLFLWEFKSQAKLMGQSWQITHWHNFRFRLCFCQTAEEDNTETHILIKSLFKKRNNFIYDKQHYNDGVENTCQQYIFQFVHSLHRPNLSKFEIMDLSAHFFLNSLLLGRILLLKLMIFFYFWPDCSSNSGL